MALLVYLVKNYKHNMYSILHHRFSVEYDRYLRMFREKARKLTSFDFLLG